MHQSIHANMLRRKQPTLSTTGYEFRTTTLAMRDMLDLRRVFQIVGIRQSTIHVESMTTGLNGHISVFL
jgi:hypothetical protein